MKKRTPFAVCASLLVFASCAMVPAKVALDDSLKAHSRGKYFGTAVNSNALFNTAKPELAERYREVIASQFNLIVPESELKMHVVWTGENTYDFTKVDILADWALSQNLKMRGHALVWHRSLPAWLVSGFNAGSYDTAAVARLVEGYITEVMGHFAQKYPGLVVAWDVVNETIGPNDSTLATTYGLRPSGSNYLERGEDFWRQSLGDDYADKAFRWARAADANAKLYYNDYHNEYINPKGEAIYTFVTSMKNRGIPIDGIGLQCHFSVSWLDMSLANLSFNPTALGQTIDRWIASGLDVQLTEVDIGTIKGQNERQAQLYADLLTASLPKTGVFAFVTWGFTDLVSWREDEKALYFDTNINPKPAYYRMLETLKSASF